MLIRELMIPKPAVLTPEMSLPEALARMKEKQLHRMPVVDGHGHLVGIISETDLHGAQPSPATLLSFWEIPSLLARITVAMLMVRDVATVAEDTPVEVAARIMADRNIGCLPVMDGPALVGMVTQNDMFRSLMELLGGRRPGTRVWGTAPGRKGAIAHLTSAIAEASGNIVGLGLEEVTDPGGVRWEITLKVQDVPRARLLAILEANQFGILDIREV